MVGIYVQNLFASSLAAGSSLKSRLAVIYPKIEDDAQYRVEASLQFSEDHLAAHIGGLTSPYSQ